MTSKSKKFVFLALGLTLFALLGTGAIYVSGLKRVPKPVLMPEYTFSKGISLEKLNLTAGEVMRLNRAFQNNRHVVKKAVLTVAGDSSDYNPKLVNKDTELKFSVQLKGKTGIVYSPETAFCRRQKLVDRISFHVEQGAKVLASYSDSPILKDREVNIVDM